MMQKLFALVASVALNAALVLFLLTLFSGHLHREERHETQGALPLAPMNASFSAPIH